MSSVTDALNYALKRVEDEFRDVPDGQIMIDQITEKFVSTSNSPPRSDFEHVIRKNFSNDEVCISLFCPSEEQIAYYPKLLVASLEAPVGHPLSKLCPLLITIIFLIHRKNLHFLQTLVVSDGLIPLIAMIDHENLYLRGQVLEILLSITDCDKFDWFKPAATSREKVLHQQLLNVGQSPLFLTKLMSNREKSYPGGSFRALQILAFILSWIRALYTKDQVLNLSVDALSELKQWTQKEPELKEQEQHKGDQEEEDEDPELQLARTLYDDFSGALAAADGDKERSATRSISTAAEGAAAAVATSSPGTASSDSMFLSDIDASSLALDKESVKDIASTANDQGPSSSVAAAAAAAAASVVQEEVEDPMEVLERLKASGNDLFKAAKYEASLKLYHQALLQIEAVEASASMEVSKVASLHSTLHCNIATAWWKLVTNFLEKYPLLELHLTSSSTAAAATATTASIAPPVQVTAQMVMHGQQKEQQELASTGDNELQAARAQVLQGCRECKQACTAALHNEPLNAKAAYRLASVLLLEGAPQEAVQVVKRTIGLYECAISETIASMVSSKSGGKGNITGTGDDGSSSPAANRSSAVDSWSSELDGEDGESAPLSNNNHQQQQRQLEGLEISLQMLKQVRRKCVAALLLSEGVCSSTSASSTVANVTAGEVVQDLGLSDKGNEILRSLLFQYQIELELPPPITNDKEDKNATSTYGKPTPTPRQSQADSKVTQTAKDIAKQLQDIDNETMEMLIGGKSNVAPTTTIGSGSGKLDSKLASKKKKKQVGDAIGSVTSGSGARKATTMPGSSAGQKSDAFLALKKNATKYEGVSSDGFVGSERNHDKENVTGKQLLESSIQLITSLWSQKLSLRKCFTCTMEESHFLLLVDTILYAHNQQDQQRKRVELGAESVDKSLVVRLIAELAACERFATMAQLALSGSAGQDRSERLKGIVQHHLESTNKRQQQTQQQPQAPVEEEQQQGEMRVNAHEAAPAVNDKSTQKYLKLFASAMK